MSRVEELEAGQQKRGWYSTELGLARTTNPEDTYLSAIEGWADAEAALMEAIGLLKADQEQLEDLDRELADLVHKYQNECIATRMERTFKRNAEQALERLRKETMRLGEILSVLDPTDSDNMEFDWPLVTQQWQKVRAAMEEHDE